MKQIFKQPDKTYLTISTKEEHTGFMKFRWFFIAIFVIIVVVLFQICVTAEPDQGTTSSKASNTTIYSIVHLSDTQNLATGYHDTYNYTFTYLDSIRDRYNISAIIITGDLVNTFDSREEWDAYAAAVNKTSIPIYVTAGNHDTNYGKDDRYYSAYTGNTDRYSITTLNDFNLVTIPYVKKTLPSKDFSNIRQSLNQSPHQLTLIATHYYMDMNGSVSRLGRDINTNIIQGPTIIMAGHKRAHFIKTEQIGQYPVVEEITNFQNGINGPTGKDYSAGTLYTVTADNRTITRVSARTIGIYPDQACGPDHIIYPLDSGNSESGHIRFE
ncbi:metallophosphoesterase [uncultured Methanospirillum sp.]|uniref:metallophosphoesterase family protein n=1 Tax=uncultured Methanospirillum sp. TaxID=262503 RepID=UPI0029C906D1|nr:metallophosphoesterase [uncultured Methanospirillum sp.]